MGSNGENAYLTLTAITNRSFKVSNFPNIIIIIYSERIVLSFIFGICFKVPPEINYAPPDYEVVEGCGAILFCNATGNPQPNITWTKQGNNSELSTSETLNLTNLTREDDGSVYKCTAANEAGSADATTTIAVFCKFPRG